MSAPGQRHLAAVVFTDIVGYTTLVQRDEQAAREARLRHRRAVEAAVAAHGGELLQYFGDGSLSVFTSAVNAVRASIDIQRQLHEPPLLAVRIGIDQGEVAYDEQGAYGDSVNVASRLQSLAAPGGILVSGDVRDQIRNQPDLVAEPKGQVSLKNVDGPVAIWSVSPARVRRIVQAIPPDAFQEPVAHSGPMVIHRGRWIVAGAVGAMCIIAALAWYRSANPGISTTPDQTGAPVWAVMPFSVDAAPPELQTFANGVVRVVTPHLDAVHSLDAVDANAVISAVGAQRDLLRSRASSIASRLGAHRFVMGSFVGLAGGTIRITAEVYELDERRVGGPIVIEDPQDSLVASLRKLAASLIALHRGGETSELFTTTASLPALTAWLRAEDFLASSRYADAVNELDAAVSADPSFAWARYRLSQAQEWNFQFLPARRSARQARQGGQGRMSARAYTLVDAWYDFLEGRVLDAEAKYRDLLNERERDVEARSGLGEVLIHYNAVRGAPLEEARAYFESVLNEAHPGAGEARQHLLELAVARRDSVAFDSLLVGLDSTSMHHLVWRVVRSRTWRTSDRAAVDARLARSDSLTLGLAAGRVAAHAHDFEEAAALASRLAEAVRTPGWRAAGQILLAQLAMGSGRPGVAQGHLRAAHPLEEDWSNELRALYLLHPLSRTPRDSLERLLQELQQWKPVEDEPGTAFFFKAHVDMHGPLRLYLLGLVSVHLGDFDEARRFAESVRNHSQSVELRSMNSRLANSILGHSAHARGQTEQALSRLRVTDLQASFDRVVVSPFLSHAYDRFALAELARERGNVQEAERWYTSLIEGTDFIFYASAHLRLAELALERGDPGGAEHHRDRLARLWTAPEPPFANLLEEINARIAQRQLNH